jgi:hypothetical protein
LWPAGSGGIERETWRHSASIFGKVRCQRSAHGELNNLNFTVGNVPWKIFRVNAIFFAAFGQAGQPLPTAQLAALAEELDHKPK